MCGSVKTDELTSAYTVMYMKQDGEPRNLGCHINIWLTGDPELSMGIPW